MLGQYISSNPPVGGIKSDVEYFTKRPIDDSKEDRHSQPSGSRQMELTTTDRDWVGTPDRHPNELPRRVQTANATKLPSLHHGRNTFSTIVDDYSLNSTNSVNNKGFKFPIVHSLLNKAGVKVADEFSSNKNNFRTFEAAKASEMLKNASASGLFTDADKLKRKMKKIAIDNVLKAAQEPTEFFPDEQVSTLKVRKYSYLQCQNWIYITNIYKNFNTMTNLIEFYTYFKFLQAN